MRKASVLVVLSTFLCAIMLIVAGCAQPGETSAEVNRRHLRKAQIEKQEIMHDIDAVFLFDEPSRLSELRFP